MRIAVIGAGYVGLVTGACLSARGHEVVCVDVSEERIAMLRRGEVPIHEPGLDRLIARNTANGRLSFSTDLAGALAGSHIAMIAVGTPPRPQDGVADLGHVMQAAADIAANARRPLVVVVKSTVPVGTCDRIARLMRELRGKADLDVVSNPEFLREGNAIGDFDEPDRIVVGVEGSHPLAVMRTLYAPWIDRKAPFLVTTRRSSELIKYASNAFLAMKVTFINEVADMCEGAGADVGDVAIGMGLDGRIGPKFLQAGPGFGGSCFPKDILALLKSANDAGAAMRLVESTIGINENRKRRMARKIETALGGDIYGRTIAVMGLAFKPGTDDMRDSPAIAIIRALQDRGAAIRGFDPEAGREAKAILSGIEIAPAALDAAAGAHAVVLMTHWPELVKLDPAQLAAVMAGRVAVDLRNAWDPVAFRAQGFRYVGVGRGAAEEGTPAIALPLFAADFQRKPRAQPLPAT